MNHFTNMPDSTITIELEWDGGFGKSANVVEGYGSDINFAKERKDPNSPYYEAPKPDPFGLRTWTASVKFWRANAAVAIGYRDLYAGCVAKEEANLKECIHAAELHLQNKKFQRARKHAA